MTACAGGDTGGTSPGPSPELTASASPLATASSEQSSTPAATPQATTAATSAPGPEPVALEVDSLAEVIADDPLVIRSEPRVADDSEIYENQLQMGDVLFVTDGPISASGYQWYQVQPIQRPGSTFEEELPFGYVAAGSREGEPWLAALDFECPASPPSLEAIAGLEPLERLYCFGDQELTLVGESLSCGVQDPATIEPGWFENPICSFAAASLFGIRFPPESDGAPSGGTVEVTGHFDDPRAQDCVWLNDSPVPEPPAEAVVLRCRTEFVATSVTAAP